MLRQGVVARALFDLRFTILFIPDNVGIRKAQRRIHADARRLGRRSSSRFSLLTPTRVSFKPGDLSRSCFEPRMFSWDFRLTSMTCFCYRNCCRSSQLGFPLLTPTMQEGQDSGGWMSSVSSAPLPHSPTE